MNKNKFDHLIDKYWSADTSLEEEKQLKEYFNSDQSEDSMESALFQYFASQKKQAYSREIRVRPAKRIMNLRVLLSIAASVVILSFAYFAISPDINRASPQQITISDPEEAWQVTMDALSLVNTKMTKGEMAVRQNMKHFDKTLIFK